MLTVIIFASMMAYGVSGIVNDFQRTISYISPQVLPNTAAKHIIELVPANFLDFNRMVSYQNLILNQKKKERNAFRFADQYKFRKPFLHNPLKKYPYGKEGDPRFEYFRFAPPVAMILTPSNTFRDPILNNHAPAPGLLRISDGNIYATPKKIFFKKETLPLAIPKNVTTLNKSPSSFYAITKPESTDFSLNTRAPIVVKKVIIGAPNPGLIKSVSNTVQQPNMKLVTLNNTNDTKIFNVQNNITVHDLISEPTQHMIQIQPPSPPTTTPKQIRFLPTIIPHHNTSDAGHNFFTIDEAITSQNLGFHQIHPANETIENTRFRKPLPFWTPLSLDVNTESNLVIPTPNAATSQNPLFSSNFYNTVTVHSAPTNIEMPMKASSSYNRTFHIVPNSDELPFQKHFNENINNKQIENNIFNLRHKFEDHVNNLQQVFNKSEESPKRPTVFGLLGSSHTKEKERPVKRYIRKLCPKDSVKMNITIPKPNTVVSPKLDETVIPSGDISVEKSSGNNEVKCSKILLTAADSIKNVNQTCFPFETVLASKQTSSNSNSTSKPSNHDKNETPLSTPRNEYLESTTTLPNSLLVDLKISDNFNTINSVPNRNLESNPTQHPTRQRHNIIRFSNQGASRGSVSHSKESPTASSRLQSNSSNSSSIRHPRRKTKRILPNANDLMNSVSTKTKVLTSDNNNSKNLRNSSINGTDHNKIKYANTLRNVNSTISLSKESTPKQPLHRNILKHTIEKTGEPNNRTHHRINTQVRNSTESSIMKIAKDDHTYRQGTNSAAKTSTNHGTKSRYNYRNKLKENLIEKQQGLNSMLTNPPIRKFQIATETPVLPLEVFFMDLNKPQTHHK